MPLIIYAKGSSCRFTSLNHLNDGHSRCSSTARWLVMVGNSSTVKPACGLPPLGERMNVVVVVGIVDRDHHYNQHIAVGNKEHVVLVLASGEMKCGGA